MGKVEVRCIRVGMLQTNCYVVYDDEVRKALIADPGDDAGFIEECTERIGVEIAAFLLTHGHSDHFKALTELKEKYNVSVYVPADDAYRLKYQGSFVTASYIIQPDDVMVHDGDRFEIGGMKFTAIHTPGHTEGGTCYYFPENGILLSGDTLFCHSWGRTDFPGGDEAALFRSIREKLLPLPENTIVLPGHEGTTTIGEERRIHRFTI